MKAKKTKFFGARLDPDLFHMVEEIAQEEKVDRTVAVKILIRKGWRTYRISKALEQYEKGSISLDKAAALAGLNVHEMMQEAAAHGITSTESIAELRAGLERLRMQKT